MRVFSITAKQSREQAKVRLLLAFVCAGLAAAVFETAAAAPQARKPAPAPTATASLNVKEVKAMVVGHSVALTDGGMTWYFNPDGTYDADDGRNGRFGKYTVQADGKLCWSETTGVKGCFQYYRQGGKLKVRRTDPGHSTELGAVTLGKL